MQVVSQGPDEADNWITENIQANNICIIADIPLADRWLKKSAKVLNLRGEEFTEDMIGDAMATRELVWRGLKVISQSKIFATRIF